VPPLRFFVNFSLSLMRVHFCSNSMTSWFKIASGTYLILPVNWSYSVTVRLS
jgi:hypothetical protein